MKGLIGLALQNKYTVTPLTVSLSFLRALLAAFREDGGLQTDSNKLSAYLLWVL